MSGVIALDAHAAVIQGDIRVQTRSVLERVRATLEELELTIDDVVRTNVWLADFGEFAAFNEEYAKFFSSSLPARSAVQAQLYGGARVEIEVQAWAGTPRDGDAQEYSEPRKPTA
jgi:enamine deaminase RidA (YjgF/YER057c/UK114 family)